MDPGPTVVSLALAPEADRAWPSAAVKSVATPDQACRVRPPSTTGWDNVARTASTRPGSVGGSGKFWTFVATYVAIEMPPALT